MIRRLIYLIILAAIAFFAYRWCQSNPDKMDQLKKTATDIKKQVE